MEDTEDLTLLPGSAGEAAARPAKRRRRNQADCIDLSLEDDACEGSSGFGSAHKVGLVGPGTAEQRKRAWTEMASAGADDALLRSFAGQPPSGGAGGGGGGGGGAVLQWGATGARQRRQRTPARAAARQQALALDEDPEVSIVDLVSPPALPQPRPQAQPHPQGQPRARRVPAAAGAQRPSAGQQAAKITQEEEDARLAAQLAQEEEIRRRRAEDFARARMQMWQELEEAATMQRASRGRSQPQQQQQPQPRRRSGSRRAPGAAASGGGGGAYGAFVPPPFLPGMPPHLAFGGGGGGWPHGGGYGHGGGGRGGGGGGGMPASFMALREAVMGMQRTGLPPQLLFSDRDFTADDYDMLCRLDETVENKKGASAAQLSSLPTQTVPAGGLLGEGGERLACSVCLEEFGEGQQLCTLPCVHKFHRNCIQTWLQQKATCPVCQQKL